MARPRSLLNPYLWLGAVYLALALIMALAGALTSYGLLPWFTGLRWLRVHFVTLGILAQAVFGLLPGLVAARAGRPAPGPRWDIWLALNLGLFTLAVGIPLVNAALILTGGTLVFVAASLLTAHVVQLRARPVAGGSSVALPRPGPDSGGRAPTGGAFYLAALSFLLFGIFVGTGLWLGWGQALGMARPTEVHIHSNLWGFTSLLFAGLIVDLYPAFAGRALAWPRSIGPIFWLLAAGALLLVVGPWLGSLPMMAVGFALLWLGTVWLLANVVRPLVGAEPALWRAPGVWHILAAYAWVLAPIGLGPLVRFGGVQVPAGAGELNAPQALVYGWLLQLAFAFLPYLVARLWRQAAPAPLGGSWVSLLAALGGSLFLVLSIFFEAHYGLLHGTAYALWTISLAPAALVWWRLLHPSLESSEMATG